jgi:hypothetical protein
MHHGFAPVATSYHWLAGATFSLVMIATRFAHLVDGTSESSVMTTKEQSMLKSTHHKKPNKAVQPIPYRATFGGSVRMSRASRAVTSHAESWIAVGDC